MGMGKIVYRFLVAFGAACVGLFVGFVGGAIVLVPLNLAVSASLGLAVSGAIASLAVPIDVTR